jgi:hypothetical protein
MTLLDAQQYDEARGRRRNKWIAGIVILVLFASWAAYHLRDHRERATVNRFFAFLQKQNYESAYGVWFNDPAWRQHPNKYPNYPFNDFYRDWGPGGEWGLIKSHKVNCSLSPGNGSGVIVQVTVNDRAEHPNVWVEKSDMTLSFPPNEIECGNWWSWLTE